MLKKYACVESTFELQIGKYRVRVWINEDVDNVKDHYDNGWIIDSISGHWLGFLGGVVNYPAQLANFIAQIETVNAVQIIDEDSPTKNGIMIYTT